MEYEFSVLKAPHEGMSKDFRANQKALEKELAQVTSAVAEMSKATNMDKETAAAGIDKLVGKLQGLKRKVLVINVRHYSSFVILHSSFFIRHSSFVIRPYHSSSLIIIYHF